MTCVLVGTNHSDMTAREREALMDEGAEYPEIMPRLHKNDDQWEMVMHITASLPTLKSRRLNFSPPPELHDRGERHYYQSSLHF